MAKAAPAPRRKGRTSPNERTAIDFDGGHWLIVVGSVDDTMKRIVDSEFNEFVTPEGRKVVLASRHIRVIGEVVE